MKKILILGSCGAGKSTFAKRLHDVLGIKIIHLDQHYWKPNWIRTEQEEWKKKVSELVQGDEWIIDGNYRSTLDFRLPQADTVIWLNHPRLVCFCRVLKRRFRKNRVDELDGCDEQITWELVKWVLWTFPRVNKKEISKKLELVKEEKDVFILKSNSEIEAFLARLKK